MKVVTGRTKSFIRIKQREGNVAWGLVTADKWRKVLELKSMQFLGTLGMSIKKDLSQS